MLFIQKAETNTLTLKNCFPSSIVHLFDFVDSNFSSVNCLVHPVSCMYPFSNQNAP